MTGSFDVAENRQLRRQAARCRRYRAMVRDAAYQRRQLRHAAQQLDSTAACHVT